MRNYFKVILFVIIVLGFNKVCLASPLSNIMSLFQRNLVINVSYKNHSNLIQGSEVYSAGSPKGQKTLIGTVKKVFLVESKMSKVEIIIDKKHRKKIYETTQFILMSNFFSKNPNTYIVAVSSSEASDKIPLKSGSSVKGVTFLEYKIATAGKELKIVMDSIKKQNNEILSKLEEQNNMEKSKDLEKRLMEIEDMVEV